MITTPTLRTGTLSLPEVYSDTFGTYRAAFGLFVALTVAPLVALLAVIVAMVIAMVVVARDGVVSGAPGVGTVLTVALAGFVGIVFVTLLQYRFQAMTSLATNELAHGRRPTWSGLWEGTRGFFGRILPLFLAGAALVVVLYVGLALAILAPLIRTGAPPSEADAVAAVSGFVVFFLVLWVLALWVGVRLLLLIPVMGVEQATGFEALGRSWRLTRGAFWPLLGHWLLLQIVLSAPLTVVSLTGQTFLLPMSADDPSSPALIGAVLGYLVLVFAASFLIVPFGYIYLTILYLNRLRQLAGEPPAGAQGWGQPSPGSPSPGWSPGPPQGWSPGPSQGWSPTARPSGSWPPPSASSPSAGWPASPPSASAGWPASSPPRPTYGPPPPAPPAPPASDDESPWRRPDEPPRA